MHKGVCSPFCVHRMAVGLECYVLNFFKNLAYVFDSRDCLREERSSCPLVIGAVAASGEEQPQDTLEQHLRYPGRGGLSALAAGRGSLCVLS